MSAAGTAARFVSVCGCDDGCGGGWVGVCCCLSPAMVSDVMSMVATAAHRNRMSTFLSGNKGRHSDASSVIVKVSLLALGGSQGRDFFSVTCDVPADFGVSVHTATPALPTAGFGSSTPAT